MSRSNGGAQSSKARRYLIAVFGACLAATLSVALSSVTDGPSFALPLAVVALLALGAGEGPAVLASVLTALLVWFAPLAPRMPLRYPGWALPMRAVTFLVASAGLSLAIGAYRRSRSKLAQQRAQSERAVERANQATAALRESEEGHRTLAEQLREADKRKDDFLAMLSHELRNPLAPIRNSLYILEHAKPGTAQAFRAHAVIDRQVTHMARLIDDLLDMTRISRGKIQLRLERIDLIALVRRTIDDHRTVFLRNGVGLVLEQEDGPLWVDGDATRLAQALGNLLHNAAKFSSAGGRTVVRVGRDGAGRAAVRVRDSGVGMDPALVSRLFEPFTQADTSLDRTRGGLGLGLALVKVLVEMHGGEVTAHSDGLGTGAEFTVQLPSAAAPVARPEGERARAPAPAPSRRVLVIEDNVDAAETLREALEIQGHRVEVAYTGPEGLQRAREFHPQVVLCDIGLPGMDGYQVALALRSDRAARTACLVALTGYARPDDVERARRAGFDEHLAKPPELSRLEHVLETLPSSHFVPREEGASPSP